MAEQDLHASNLPEEKALKDQIHPWRDLSALGVIGMELSWVALWFRIFTQTGLFVSFMQAWLILGLFCLLAFLGAYLLDLFSIRLDVRRIVLGVLLLGSLLGGIKLFLYSGKSISVTGMLATIFNLFGQQDLSIPAEFMVMLFILWAWWRGLSVVGSYIGPDTARGHFQTGVAAILVYGLIAPLTGEVLPLALFLFLAWGLVSMASARLYVLSRLRGGRAVAFNRAWAGGLLSTVLGVLGLAALAAYLMEAGLSGVLIASLLFTLKAIIYIGNFLMLPVLALLLLIVPALSQFLYGPLMSLIHWAQGLFDQLRKLFEGMQIKLPFELHINWLAFKPWLLWGALVIIAGLVLLALSVRLRSFQPGGVDDDNQSLASGNLLSLLLASLRKGVQNLADRLGQIANLGRAGRLLAAARIRRIYAELMDLSAGLGLPRPAARTPMEFLPTLADLLPGCQVDLEAITMAYVRVRYGELPETRQEVEMVETAWRRVHAAGVEKKKQI